MIVVDVVTQHAEETGFLWRLRTNAVHEPHYSLGDLARLDARLDAHIDGLRVAGTEGWEICMAGLASGDPGEVFAAAIVALASGDQQRVHAVIQAGIQSRDISRGLISAMAWLPYRQVMKVIQRLLEADPPLARRAGIAATAIHRRGPGPALGDSLADTNPLLRARALRAVGELGTTAIPRTLVSALKDDDIECRFWAAWSLTLLGDTQAVRVLQTIAERSGPRREPAANMALRRLEPAGAKTWQRDLARDADLRRLAVIGAGVMGDPTAIPWLIDQMASPELARVAGEAVSMITGVDLALEHLEGKRPEGFESGPTEDPEDENVALDADENLPWPDPTLIEKWWGTHRSELKAGVRHLLGKPITPDSLQYVLRKGRQRQRAAAAIELAIANPGEALFEVRAPGFRQQQILGARP